MIKLENDVLSTFFAALIGSFMGGLYTLEGVRESHRLEIIRNQSEEENLIANFLQMIHTEINVLWDQYNEKMGKTLETLPNNSPLQLYYPISQDYFSVYNNNTMILGKIENERLRTLITTIYSMAKGLVDGFKMNNELLNKFEQTIVFNQQTNNSFMQRMQQEQLNNLAQYATHLKESHKELDQQIKSFNIQYQETIKIH